MRTFCKFAFVFVVLHLSDRVLFAFSTEFEYQLDAYYSAVDWNINLSTVPIPLYKDKTEAEIYKLLLLRPKIPRQVVLEASVNPLPIAGTVIKKQARGFYDSMAFGSDQNLVRSVTAGFEEPAALSLFLGNMIDFKPMKKKNYGEGRGYLGTLFSAGTQHIKDNVLIEDHWWEAEWKIKGDRKLEDIKLNWSFRLGAKFHANKAIADVFFIGLRRSRIDYLERQFSWFKNSGFLYKFDFSVRDLHSLQHQLIVDKKFPVKNHKWVPSMALGLTWKDQEKYSGALRETVHHKLEVLIQPNIEF